MHARRRLLIQCFGWKGSSSSVAHPGIAMTGGTGAKDWILAYRMRLGNINMLYNEAE